MKLLWLFFLLFQLNLQGNPVVFCPYYRRATIACLYPIPRVEPVSRLDIKERVWD